MIIAALAAPERDVQLGSCPNVMIFNYKVTFSALVYPVFLSPIRSLRESVAHL